MKQKKPTTLNEQVEFLLNKNIIIEDKHACISFLSKVNYYCLSEYFLPFIQKETEKCFTRIEENSNSLVVRHHQTHCQGHFPLWVIIDFFSIGMLSHFYRGMKNPDKAALAEKLYNVNYQILESWLRCLTDLRNRCAHYARLYYWVFPALPKMPNGITYTPTRRLFAQLYMLKMLYPDAEKWNKEFLKPLIKLVNQYKTHISKKHLDFPYRWKSMLTK